MSREFPKNNPPENTSPKIALPTVGRIVHVFGPWEAYVDETTPRAALVCGTEEGQLTINAAVFNRRGELVAIQSVPHASLPRHTSDPYWDWMDYQKGQAAKTEQLQRQLEETHLSTKGALIGDTGGALRQAFAPNDGEMGKLQAGAPSLVDGKR